MHNVLILEPASAEQLDGYPILRLAQRTPLVEQVETMLAGGLAVRVVELDRYARQLAGITEPLYLYLSTEDGGFARWGFWLEEEGGRRFVGASFVDVVVTEETLATGWVEGTFCHEMGHVLVRTLLGETPGPARKPHFSHTVTDYPTAFDEGVAEHFEVLLRDVTDNPWLREEKRRSDLLEVWVSHVDGALRQDGVRRNLFVHRKAIPDSALESGADPYKVWRDGLTSPALHRDLLKNGQAMLSCEGVGSTLIYRIATSHPEAPFHLLHAIQELGRTEYHPGRPLLAELAEAYARLFPEEAPTVYRIFVETTWGATVDPALARDLEALGREGRNGNMEAFAGGLKSARERLTALVEKLVTGSARLTDGLGPELWLLNESLKVSVSLFRQVRNLPLSLNLNTAEESDLVTLPGVDLGLARRIVAARQAAGYFSSLEDLRTVEGLTDELMATLTEMARAMEQAGAMNRI